MAQMVKNMPAVQETLVQSLGQEDPLEKEMATHSSIFAWRIPSTVETGGKSLQLCLTLCDPMDCNPPTSQSSRTLQAKILEWVAMTLSRGSF